MAFFVKHKTRGYYAGNINGREYWSNRVRMWCDTQDLAEKIWERVIARTDDKDSWQISVVDEDGTVLN